MRRRTAMLVLVMLTVIALPSRSAYAANPPTISWASWSGTALTAGGTAVTINGSGFVDGATVTFGGVAASQVTVVSSSQITATTPPGPLGTVIVLVTNPDGQSATSNFTYTSAAAPIAITAVSPSTGSTTGGTVVSISGSGFVSGAAVLFGGFPAINVSVYSPTLIVATTPIGPGGVVSVVVTNPGGQAASFPGFVYGIQGTDQFTVTGVSPTAGAAGGGTFVSITGVGFVAGATVSFGGFPASNVAVLSGSLITATTPAGPTGTVAVVVTNPSGQAAAFTGFSYPGQTTGGSVSGQPYVAAVSPSSGSSAGGTVVSISGSGFTASATVTFGGIPATNVVVVNSTLITATTPSNPVGPVTVLVASSAGPVGGLSAAFTYLLATPLVVSIVPASGSPAGGVPITITGSGFVAGATVSVGGAAATNVTVVSPTQITATTPPGPAGAAVVLVTNPGGSISGLATGFTYSTAIPAPVPTPASMSVVAVSPSTGAAAGGTVITITGSGFVTGATVTIGGAVANATVIGPTQIVATTPPALTTGAVTVLVANPGAASASLAGGFTYLAASQPPPTGGAIPAGGSGLFVFRGGSNADLLRDSGCPVATAVFWTTDASGNWVGYIPAVSFALVNATWNALFPSGIPPSTAIFARCA